MTNTLLCIISSLVGYLLGSISTSILVAKTMGKIDIREHGSGNAGATNTLRVLGKKAAIFVVLGDALKGALSVLIANLLCVWFNIDNSLPLYLAGFFAVIGHNFPLYFGFKGGKGVLTSIVTILALDVKIGLIALVFALVIMATTKYVSLGSCLGAVLVMVLALILRWGDVYFIALCLILGILVLVKHKSNIKRLLNGTESKLGSKSK
ncbi:MAG: glycerol-3-phosphate 1-O-acyltransferase PlsY [Ruminococcaceae bacterium]|nr:glycerol-3-phosphate 1-O-acyltransferase PlsY [Oscillospiraceae bacterium]